ncbi:sucrase ferredoxin [Herbihabitans rhizosphaerae]|uniref:sucrase ferredoxin n=1 Tax=Herbihabitans rhizosphaerae TaxID=1872711 RepID=UPI001F5FCBC7|nr:sucrase ferredoxin [Herbihabitans rhizosphaerae]
MAESLSEPLAGTAAVATSWLCLEQPGPWGADAITHSHLDHDVAAELAARIKGTGVRMVLIRRPGSHPDRHQPVPRRVYLAHTRPGRTWLRQGLIGEPKELLDLDFAAIGAGEAPVLGEPRTTPLLLVCTNGKRDVCCALRGRPIATTLAESHGDAVWESTHLGGHRFAPTALCLPSGYCFGRIDLDLASRLLAGAGAVTDRCRGRSTWSKPAQVGELAVRSAIGEHDPDALTVGESGEDGPLWTVEVSHVDGRRWLASVRQEDLPMRRPPSCGAAPEPATALAPAGVRLLG